MSIVATSRAVVSWPTQQQVLPGGQFQVYYDDRDGSVDYQTPLPACPIEAWPDGEGKIGDGLGPDGSGADGYGYGGVGDGMGADSMGPDGFGATLIAFLTPLLLDGTWEFAVVAMDVAGNEITPATIEQTVALAGVPQPPGNLQTDSYDSGTDTLAMSWTLSTDDDG